MGKWVILGALVIVVSGCTSPGKKSKIQDRQVTASEVQWQEVEPPQNFVDDLGVKNLSQVLKLHERYWRSRAKKHASMNVAGREVSTSVMRKHFTVLRKLASKKSWNLVAQYLKEHFSFMGVKPEASEKLIGHTFLTSYFEPVIPGSPTRTDRFSQPLYGVPGDMVTVQMGQFAETFPRWSMWEGVNTEQKSKTPVIRGRLQRKPGSVVKDVVPYFDRKEIDQMGYMSRKSEILVYVDPVDSFFLQIQGSGAIQLKNGRQIRVGYAAQNGHPYYAIGKAMFPAIPRNKMSLEAIENFLRNIPESDAQEFLSLNPSYVFFRKLEGRGKTYMGTEVVDGRTIATDFRIFPKGVLAWLTFPKPALSENSEAITVSRLVVDQDTGGAIRGPHRVDLFWGQGDEAKAFAGQVRHEANILYLVPKKTL